MALFPSSGSSQTLSTALVAVTYLTLTAYSKPYPTAELNQVDFLVSLCTLLEMVRHPTLQDTLFSIRLTQSFVKESDYRCALDKCTATRRIALLKRY